MALWKRKKTVTEDTAQPSTPEEAVKVMKGLVEMYPEMMSDPDWGSPKSPRKSKKTTKKKKVIAKKKEEAPPPETTADKTASDLRKSGYTDDDFKRMGYKGNY